MFIIRTLIITVYIYYTLLTTNTATNEVFCLLYFRTQCKQYTQCVNITGVCKVCKSTLNQHKKCNFPEITQACKPYRNENTKL